MKNIRNALLVGVVMFGTASVAHADVVRLAIVIADNQADYENNAKLVPMFETLLSKGTGVKDVHVGMDPALRVIGSTSVWPNVEDVKSVTDTDEWKATVAKLKAKPYVPVILQIP